MDALILSCGTGGGHDSAGKAVQMELERRGHHAVMLNPYMLHGDRLTNRIDNAYLFLAKQAPWLFGIIYKAGELYRKLPVHSPVYFANRGMVPVMDSYLTEHPVDIVIMTHIFPGEIMTNMKRQGLDIPKTILVATDYVCIPFAEESECDAYVIPAEPLTEHFAGFGLPKEKIHPLGIPTDNSFSYTESREEARRRLRLDARKKYILVCAGSMGGGKIKKAIRLLKKYVEESNGTELIIVCGNNQKLYEKLKKDCSSKLHIIGYTDDMAGYMRASDIFVTKPGGLSSTEACVCGIPMIHTAAIPGCETYNVRYFADCGLSESWNLSKKGLHNALERLDDEHVRASMASNQQKIWELHAAAGICDLAESLAAQKGSE